MSPLEQVSYDPNGFVNRELEITMVRQVIIHVQQNGRKNEHPRTIIFQGGKGSGKSWLSLHLKRTILAQFNDVTSLLVCFDPQEHFQLLSDEWKFDEDFLRSFSDEALAPHLEQFFRWMAQQLGITLPETLSLRNRAGLLVREINERYQKRILVIVLDSIIENDWKLLNALEQYLLASLASLPNVVIIMTGRGRPFPWASPYLRAMVHSIQLAPFTLEHTNEQLTRQTPDSAIAASLVVELGGGHPLTNRLLADKGIEALDQAIETLLAPIPPERRPEMRRNLEALTIFDGFRENEMGTLLATHLDGPTAPSWSPAAVRRVRDEMNDFNLILWQDDHLFHIDPSIRTLTSSYLRYTNPNQWKRLHCRAYRLYQDYAARYPRHSDYYVGRATYHAQMLKMAHFQVEDCIEITSTTPA